MLAHVLGGGSNSRLYRALVVEKGIAVSAGAGYQGSALDLTRFSVYGTPANGTTLPQLESAIEAVITELAEKGVSAEELERSKTRLIADVDLCAGQPEHARPLVWRRAHHWPYGR